LGVSKEGSGFRFGMLMSGESLVKGSKRRSRIRIRKRIRSRSRIKRRMGVGE
jgi:hypothetical protein